MSADFYAQEKNVPQPFSFRIYLYFFNYLDLSFVSQLCSWCLGCFLLLSLSLSPTIKKNKAWILFGATFVLGLFVLFSSRSSCTFLYVSLKEIQYF